MYKVICKYTKTGDLKFISHLDVLRLMQRAINRAGLPAKYSEGFNPHIKIAFGFPLSLGVESLGEYFELELKEKVEINEIIDRLNEVLPNKMKIMSGKYYDGKQSLMTICEHAEYLVNIETENLDIEKLSSVLKKITNEGIIYYKEKKSKAKKTKNKIIKKELNTNLFVHYASAKKISENKAVIELVFNTTGNGSIKVSQFIDILDKSFAKINYYTATKVEALNSEFKPVIE